MNSGHFVKVVPFVVETHPNPEATKLGVVKVDAYNVCVNLEDWKNIGGGQFPDRACWIPFDSLVPVSNPNFTFLAPKANTQGLARIQVIRLKKVWSYGFLVPCPPQFNIGDDVTEHFGVKHFEPEEDLGDSGKLSLGQTCKAPELVALPGKFDLEHLQKYHRLIPNGTKVQVQEKVDGCLKDDTLVLMSTLKQKKISEIKPGNLVKSFNISKGIFEDKKILNVIIRKPDKRLKWLKIKLENGKELIITSNHKVLTKNGYIEAGKLTHTDEIISY